MTPEQMLAIPPRVLTQAQREFYFSEGYILLEAIIGDEWMKKLRDATEEMVERSRKVTRSDPSSISSPTIGRTRRGCAG